MENSVLSVINNFSKREDFCFNRLKGFSDSPNLSDSLDRSYEDLVLKIYYAIQRRIIESKEESCESNFLIFVDGLKDFNPNEENVITKIKSSLKDKEFSDYREYRKALCSTLDLIEFEMGWLN